MKLTETGESTEKTKGENQRRNHKLSPLIILSSPKSHKSTATLWAALGTQTYITVHLQYTHVCHVRIHEIYHEINHEIYIHIYYKCLNKIYNLERY